MEDSFPCHGSEEEWWNQQMKGNPMSKLWYLPLAAVLGAASLSVWAQANAGPPPAVSPGVVVSNVDSGSKPATVEDSPKPDDSPLALASPAPTPTDSLTAVPEHTQEIQIVPAEPVTLAPVQIPQVPGPVDDKGGLRAPEVSDDGAAHDVNDDKGGLRAPEVSDDGAAHDAGDDKGGLRERNASDDGRDHDSKDDKGGLR